MKFPSSAVLFLGVFTLAAHALPTNSEIRDVHLDSRAVVPNADADLELRSYDFDTRSDPEDLEMRSEWDTDLAYRAEGDLEEMERRRGGGVGDVAKLIVDIFVGLANQVKADKMARGQFTSSLVSQLSGRNPKMNYVVCHTKHRYRFDGNRGSDWTHSHQEFDIKVGGTIGYEIYAFKSGEFWRQGDGGYLNWAYSGNVKSKNDNGKHLTFGTR